MWQVKRSDFWKNVSVNAGYLCLLVIFGLTFRFGLHRLHVPDGMADWMLVAGGAVVGVVWERQTRR